jgi:hypothetical protein
MIRKFGWFVKWSGLKQSVTQERFTIFFRNVHEVILGILLPLPPGIGTYTTRHPGRDCQDPDAMDGNIELRTPIFSYMKLLLI